MRNLILVLLLFLLFISCSDDVGEGGSMGECMIGTFITEEHTPVDQAKVKLYQKNSDGDLVIFDSTTTNGDGCFTFNSPNAGLYCLESYVKDGDKTDTLLTFFTEGVEYISGVKDLGMLIMKAPGKIKGQVTFDKAGVSGVLCYIPGTSYNAYTDDSGLFVVSGLAENRYNLLVDGALYDEVLIKDIDVVSGQTTDIGEISVVLDTTLAPLPPEGITASYDSTTGLCQVSWDSLQLSDLAGYLLYRQTAEQEFPELVQAEKIADTFFVDSLWKSVFDKSDKTVHYQLKSIDNENNMSLTFSSKFTVTPTSGPLIDDGVSVAVPIQGVLSGNTGEVSKVTATIKGASSDVNTLEWHPVSKKFVGSLKRADTGSVWTTEIRVYDSNNLPMGYSAVAFDKMTDTITVPAFDCENGKPTVTAMGDTTLTISDSLLLTASVVDSLSKDGKVTGTQEFTYEWSMGGGDFVPVSTLDTTIILSEVVTDSFTAVVRVTDSDGNVSYPDTVEVTVKNDVPVIEIDNVPTEPVFDGETITLKIKAFDTLGTVVSTQYKLESQSAFSSFSGDSLSITIPSVPDADFTVLVKATDEDGNSAVDSCQFPVNVWSKVFGGADNDESKVGLELDDGSLLIAGNSSSFSASQDILLYKINSKGEELWKKTYGGDKEESIRGMTHSSTGVLLCGMTKSKGAGDSDFYVLSLDVSGNILWEKTYGYSNYERASFIDKYDDSSFLVMGETNSLGNGDHDGFVLKINTKGDTLWTKTYGGKYFEQLGRFVVCPNGDVVILGYKKNGKDNLDAWLIKINSNGEFLWEKTYGDERKDVASYLALLPNGHMVMSGTTNAGGPGGAEGWIYEIDSGGRQLWKKVYGSKMNTFCQIVKPMDDGNYLLTGAQKEPTDSWLVKIDTKGEIIWERTFGKDKYEFSWDAIELKAGGFLSVSYSNSFSNNYDFWITKFDPHGNSIDIP